MRTTQAKLLASKICTVIPRSQLAQALSFVTYIIGVDGAVGLKPITYYPDTTFVVFFPSCKQLKDSYLNLGYIISTSLSRKTGNFMF